MKQLEQKFSHDPNLFIKDNKPNLNVIKNCCNSLNQAIDSFKIIANEFTEIYGLLYKREKKNEKENNNNQDFELREQNQISSNGHSDSEKLNKNEINEISLKVGEGSDDENEIQIQNIKRDDDVKKNDWWTLFFN